MPAELRDFLDGWLGTSWKPEPLRGDASTRSYIRVHSDAGTWIVAFYPEAIRDQAETFIRAFEAVTGTGRVPDIIRHCGFAIGQLDVGSETLSGIVKSDPERGRELYLKAVEALVEFQDAAVKARDLNPPFDVAKFSAELSMTGDFYFRRLREETSLAVHDELDRSFTTLAQNLAKHPYVLCHRDYHGENIHVNGEDLYIIDYQDLRMGPDTYDMASLMRDRGMVETLGRDFENDAIDRYAELAGLTDVRARYFEALLQRTIKTVGTFAMQAVTRNRRHYLDYIGPALRSIRECVDALPEYEPLARLFPKADD